MVIRVIEIGGLSVGECLVHPVGVTVVGVVRRPEGEEDGGAGGSYAVFVLVGVICVLGCLE